MDGIVRIARGALTVGKRRGIRYFGYLATGFGWPTATYRFCWGPQAPRVGRALFGAAQPLVSRRATRAELTRHGVIMEDEHASGAGADAVTAGEIERLMDQGHAAGITGLRTGFDDVVRVDGGGVRFRVLPGARSHRRRGAHYLAERDADRRAFNTRFGTSLLTEAEARRQLQAHKARVPQGYRDYAPIDFGGGLAIGRIASTDSGTGRWDFFNGTIVAPLVAGRRVLDLGCNNGSLPLMMLRGGAREVVAIEFTPAIADFARLNAQILSWRDVRPYRMEVITGDMRLFLEQDLGPFDVVTAFCSLYYLPEEDMARIIAKAAGIGATLILQANQAIHNLPAQASQLEQLMHAHGYSEVTIHAPSGFARPILVGAPVADAASRNLATHERVQRTPTGSVV